MSKETFGASQLSLVASALTMAGQAGWTQRDWEVAQKLEFWQQMKLVNDGDAVVMPWDYMASAKERMIYFYARIFGLGGEAERALENIELESDQGNPDLSATLLILPQAVADLKKAFYCIQRFWWQDPGPYTAYPWYERIEACADNGHMRPSGDYLLHHRGGNESDTVHKGKSYDDAMTSMLFMNHEEYILVWTYSKWLRGNERLDTFGSTRLYSKWPGGSAVLANSSGPRLRLSYCRPDTQHSSAGPREVSFTSL